MPTTKKVAPLTIKKSAPKAQKKTAPKKSSTVVSSVTKKTKSNLIATATDKTPTLTKVAVTTSSTKKLSRAQVTTKTPTFVSKFKITTPSLQLALLSPYRLPVSAEKIAISTARFGGVFFVVVGAIFTLFFANGSFGTSSQLASISSGTSDSGTTGTPETGIVVDCSDPLQYMSTSCATVVDKTPDVAFQVDGSDTIKGIVRVRVKVAQADRVVLNSYFKTQSNELKIGIMQKISEDTWELYWNTTTFDDGNYKLKVLVGNGYGVYEVLNTSYHSVENNPLVDIDAVTGTTVPTTTASTATTPTSNSSATTTIPTAEVKATDVVLTVRSNAAQSEYNFEVTVAKADKVKLYAYHVPTSKNILLGYALRNTATTWNYKWVASTFAEGEYRIKAQVLNNLIESTSNPLSLTLQKTVAVTDTSTTTTPLAVKPLDVQTLEPKASIQIQASSPISKIVGIKIDVDAATKIELYTQERYGLIKKYLGTATTIDSDTWVYGFDSTKIPNGEYRIVALIKNQYGAYESVSAFVKVQNTTAVVYTPKQEEQVKVLTSIGSELKSTADESSTEEVVKPKNVPSPVSANSEEDDTENIEEAETIDDSQNKQYVATFDTRIESELQRLASAFRMNDQKAIIAAKIRLEKIKQDSVLLASDSEAVDDATKQIDELLRKAIARTEEDVKVTEKIITERTQKEASQDSDKDGVADYDEVAMYKTDPFVADSDNDGFNDGAEILSGYNPTDPKAEALVVFESPKETGVVREDILEVQSVITATKNDDETSAKPEAIITGKALPNSFVTLYIFSTPTIVTVKTEADGSWNYRFDKELEDGEHQVYVGVTDNAGKLVAKSTPFTFIKTAEAFTPADAEVQAQPAVAVQEKTFLSEYMVYLVLSISVVAIGLVLILLGLHLDSRQRKIGVVTTEAQPVL